MIDLSMPLIILTPLIGSLICFVTRRQWAVWIGLVTAALTTGLSIKLIWMLVTEGVQTYALGGWQAPLGIHLRADGLSAIHLFMTAVVGLAISVYAHGYFGAHHDDGEQRSAEMFWPIWLFLWGGLNALYLSNDLFNLYVLLEIVGLAGVGLLTLTGTRAVLIAGMRYLLAAMAGSLAYLLGVALLYAAHSTLDIELLGGLVQADRVAVAALTLMVMGLLLKTALFPLHFWLPPAHASSTAPVSAILSALVVKASFYLIVRLWFQVFGHVVTVEAGQLLGMLGAGAIVWGSIQALRQTRLKMLIAYSTVAQLGYLFFLFPVAAAFPTVNGGTMAPWLVEAGKGSIYHALSHAISKASIFLSAGILLHAAGSDHMDRMRGLADRLPITVFAMALAAVNLMGLPPSGGFIAKWLTAHAVIGAGQWWWAPVIVGGGLLTAGYMFAMLRPVFLPGDPHQPLRPVPRSMEFCALAMAVVSILIGIRAADLLDVLMIGQPFVAFGSGGGPL